ncbi:unnamed protein product [Cyprideis torosa]|uniref:Transposase IS204/IS1001/IS1096/IS1165 DDE domain-containing protein n=1 Tax=Cyprideis torosa TaxID=163714 RepID=A0A7R8WP86_9CRUS|nr:unnamed protein product [Cyprideis torosa]CAG0901027.1 unnamed protein product [Cyprideis torosa]
MSSLCWSAKQQFQNSERAVSKTQMTDDTVRSDLRSTKNTEKIYSAVPEDLLKKDQAYFSNDPKDFVRGIDGKSYRRIYYLEIEAETVPFASEHADVLNSTALPEDVPLPDFEVSWVASSEPSMNKQEETVAEAEETGAVTSPPEFVIVQWEQLVSCFKLMRCEYALCCQPVLKTEKSKRPDGAAFTMTFTCIKVTFMCVTSKAILHFELFQVSMSKNSVTMERDAIEVGLKKCMEIPGIEVEGIVTDLSPSVAKLIREQFKTVRHHFDPWHITKSVKTQLLQVGKQEGYELVGRWCKSITNHLWYSMQTCGKDYQTLIRKWASLLHHMLSLFFLVSRP